MTRIEEQLSALFRKLISMEGKADTVAGEIVLAINFIVYRFNNDGDMLGYVGVQGGRQNLNLGNNTAWICNSIQGRSWHCLETVVL